MIKTKKESDDDSELLEALNMHRESLKRIVHDEIINLKKRVLLRFCGWSIVIIVLLVLLMKFLGFLVELLVFSMAIPSELFNNKIMFFGLLAFFYCTLTIIMNVYLIITSAHLADKKLIELRTIQRFQRNLKV
jgi:hypothetical protein